MRGVDRTMALPTTTGTGLRFRTAFTFAPRSDGSEVRAPVTSATETK
jgi:hypothetical protein